jgi:hypothetical protein
MLWVTACQPCAAAITLTCCHAQGLPFTCHVPPNTYLQRSAAQQRLAPEGVVPHLQVDQGGHVLEGHVAVALQSSAAEGQPGQGSQT